MNRIIRCFDDDCPQSEKIVKNVTRREIFQHVLKKPQSRLIEVLQEYKIVSSLIILDKWTIYNLFTDMCFVDNQEKLLQSKEGET